MIEVDTYITPKIQLRTLDGSEFRGGVVVKHKLSGDAANPVTR